MKVKVDSNSCIGCGACTAVCPNVFDFSDEGFAVVKTPEVSEDDKAGCQDAIDRCPVSAISVEE